MLPLSIHPSTHPMIIMSLTGLGENDKKGSLPSPCSCCTCLWLLPQQWGCWLPLWPGQQEERERERLSKAPSDPGRSGGDRSPVAAWADPGAHTVAHLQHGLWVRQLLTLVDLDVGLQRWRIMMKTSRFIPIIQPTVQWSEATLGTVVLDQRPVNWLVTAQNLKVLQQVSAGDFAAADLLLHQPLGGQQEGHQLGQLPLEVIVNVWVAHTNQQDLLIRSHTFKYTLPFNCVHNTVYSLSLPLSTVDTNWRHQLSEQDVWIHVAKEINKLNTLILYVIHIIYAVQGGYFRLAKI